MFVASDGGGGGSYVGLNPDAAGALSSALRSADSTVTWAATRVAFQVAAAGSEAGGAATVTALRAISAGLAEAATDLRWRVDMLRLDGVDAGGGMLSGVLLFESAAAAEAAGRRHAEAIKAALDDGVYGDGDEARAAMQRYYGLIRAAAVHADDPAWAGGLVEELDAAGVSNAVWFSMGEVQGDVEASRRLIAPVAAALATAMRAGTAPPSIGRELVDEPSYRLGILLTSATPETDFLVAAATSRLVDAAWTPERTDDLLGDEAAFFLQALAGDAEASYRVVTGTGPSGEHNVVHLLQPLTGWGSHDAEVAAGQVLEQGLVAYPAGQSAAEWNRATATTADVVTFTARMQHLLDDLHPDLSSSLLSLLHPHLDAVAAAGIDLSSMDAGHYDIDVAPPGGREALAVDPEDLRDFLGGVLQHERTIAQMQALVAAYAQSPRVQANRLPLVELGGRVADLEPFMGDSLRIAGLIGLAGASLEVAGHDEESRTRLLTGGLQFVSKQGINKVVGWGGPLGFVAKQTAGRGATWAVGQFSDWVASFEPIEGEEGVDALLQAFSDNTEASLREHMASDPALATLSTAERAQALAHATRIAGDMVRAQLLTVYADLVGETAAESK